MLGVQVGPDEHLEHRRGTLETQELPHDQVMLSLEGRTDGGAPRRVGQCHSVVVDHRAAHPHSSHRCFRLSYSRGTETKTPGGKVVVGDEP